MKTSETATSGVLEFGPFHLDPGRRTLTRNGESIPLPSRAFEVLLALAENPGQVLEKKVLMDRVWPDTAVEENNLAQSVVAVRKALGGMDGESRYILTVPGRGYCFTVPVRRCQTVTAIGRPARMVPAVVLATAVTSIAAGLWLGGGKATAPVRLLPLTGAAEESVPSFSPDGSRVAYWWRTGEEATSGIYVKVIGAGDPLPLAVGVGASEPAWSPDGRYIAYFRFPSGIYAVPALGGAERLIASTTDGRHAAPRMGWAPDGKRLAITDRDPGTRFRSLFEVVVETGERRQLTTGTSTWGDRAPAFSPDGKTLAFLRAKGSGGVAIHLMPASGGEPRQLTAWDQGVGGFDWTPDGREIVYLSAADGFATLWRVPVSGGQARRVVEAGYNTGSPAIARAGNRLAFVSGGAAPVDLWRVDVNGTGEHRRVAPARRRQTSPSFSPDGKKLVFASNRSGKMQIWTADVDGRNLTQVTIAGAFAHVGSPSWSPDGREIAFDGRRDGNPDIYLVPAQGGEARHMTFEASEDVLPGFSLDGRWIYFTSDRSGRFEIWKVPRSGGGAVQVTTHGGVRSLESTDGNIYYINPQTGNEIWKAAAAGGNEARVFGGSPLWRGAAWRSFYGWWTVAPGGIVYIAPEPGQATGRLRLFRFDVKTGSVEPMTALQERPPINVPSLAVSPDGRTVVYARAGQSQGGIMLLENFR